MVAWRRRTGAAALAAVFAVCADGAERGGTGETRMNYRLFYSVQTGEVESNQLTIRPDGVVTASIRYSAPGSPVRALGRYYKVVGESDADVLSVGALIRERHLLGGEVFTTALRYGGRYTLFVIEADGAKTTHMLNAKAPLPEPLGALEAKLLPLLARVGAEAPQRAVSVRLGLEPRAVAPGDELKVTLELSNAGPFPADIRNFAAFREGASDVLKLNLWTPPKAPGEDPDFAWALDLVGREWLFSERKALRAKDPYLKLPAHGSVTVWTTLRVPKTAPGPVAAELVFYSHVESEDERKNSDLVVGEYHADPVELRLLPRAAE